MNNPLPPLIAWISNSSILLRCHTTNMHQSHFGSQTFTTYCYTSIPVNHEFSLVEDRSYCTHLDVGSILTCYMDTDEWQCEIAGGVTSVMFLNVLLGHELLDQSKDVCQSRIGKQSFLATRNYLFGIPNILWLRQLVYTGPRRTSVTNKK